MEPTRAESHKRGEGVLAGNQDAGSHAFKPKWRLWQIPACQQTRSHLGRVSHALSQAGTLDSSVNQMAYFITIRRTLSRKVCERAGRLPVKELIKTLSRDGESRWHLAACLKPYRNNVEERSWVPRGSQELPNSSTLMPFPKAVQCWKHNWSFCESAIQWGIWSLFSPKSSFDLIGNLNFSSMTSKLC